MRKLASSFLLIAAFLITSESYSQQLTPYGTLFLQYDFLRNPAGTVGESSIFYASYQNYLTKITGSPENVFIGGIYQVVDNVGVGLEIDYFTEGAFTRTAIHLKGAYKYQIGRDHFVRFGLEGRVMNHRLDEGNLTIYQHEPLLRDIDKVYPHVYFKAGVLYNREDFQMELFIPEGVRNSFDITEGFYSMVQYTFYTVDDFSITPGIGGGILSGEGVWEANGKFGYAEQFFLTTRYHSFGIISAGLAFHLKQLRIATSFGQNFKHKSIGGNYELFIAYDFNMPKKKRRRIRKRR
ncbi:MAG: type IX secretion system membrane protein PorP/SprF [Cytophagales bacterium]|nr:type IX secretion system membrane protein PorP/SprF [Cytophagales bacterium]